MSASTWSPADIPDLTGRRAVVTGATGGLGYFTALELLRHGAEVVLTARDTDRARPVIARLQEAVPGARIVDLPMDLANLSSVRHATSTVNDTYDRIDILVNNAGVVTAPDRRSADGFELQIATNHLGHFAWTGGLWPLLAGSEARIVTVSSLAHSIAPGVDLRSLSAGETRRPRRRRSYAESKLANLSFALELDRRARAAGLGVTSVAAHPGHASTNLAADAPGETSPWATRMRRLTRVFGQSARSGAWSLLMAATLPHLAGGSYVGPGRLKQVRGSPQVVGTSRAARDEALAAELWRASEDAVGLEFDVAHTAQRSGRLGS